MQKRVLDPGDQNALEVVAFEAGRTLYAEHMVNSPWCVDIARSVNLTPIFHYCFSYRKHSSAEIFIFYIFFNVGIAG
jgi:hypothetical protein